MFCSSPLLKRSVSHIAACVVAGTVAYLSLEFELNQRAWFRILIFMSGPLAFILAILAQPYPTKLFFHNFGFMIGSSESRVLGIL